MKKIILLLMMSTTIGYSQERKSLQQDQIFACNDGCITGNVTIVKGQTATFTSSPTAQCTGCYDWDINGDPNSTDNSTVGTLQIVGSDIGKTVNLYGVAVGPFSIQLTYFDETGCHTCCFNGNVVNPQPNCCPPVLGGTFECRGGRNTGGILNINNNPNCPVDWAAISKIDIWLNAAYFTASGGTSSKTIMGPFTGPMGFSVVDTRVECYNGNCFGAIVTITYNNGCAPVQLSTNICDNNTPPGPLPKKNPIIVSPNPTNSIIKFDGTDLSKYKISITDDKGIEIISDRHIDSEINIQNQHRGIYLYRITDENGVVQEGRLIKE